MGYDDLKVIECRKFIEAFLGGPAKNCNIQDAVSSARVLSAAETSADSRQWVAVPFTEGTTAALR
jgi:predicted dehydrogenase